jgi:hypothetical protein
MKEALPVERKGPLTWVETRGIEPRTSCLQIADAPLVGVFMVLELRSLSGLVYPSSDGATGTGMAREDSIHHCVTGAPTARDFRGGPRCPKIVCN